MEVIPAIDLRQGRCVRLVQGRFDEETVFSKAPLAVAERWVAEGAMWLHVVNLDGALGEQSPNGEIVRQLVKATPAKVQLGGGLRSLEAITQALEMGVARAVLGTVALREPAVVREAVRRFGPERVVVAIDALERQVAVQGWQEVTAVRDVDFGRQMKALGVVRCLYTDVARDGMGTGPNLQATAEMAVETGLRVLASGGIASLEDVRAVCRLERAGVEGLIVGRALYTGAVSLPEALALARADLAPSPNPLPLSDTEKGRGPGGRGEVRTQE
ncbi:MAG: 1-(5-phosphoribosyl)-5-[(5-phosphoribosylamino)methylideneamino]imidazole-4-carboxamide isomerase [Anaerolineae bacterium]